jgi:hypothetical protein
MEEEPPLVVQKYFSGGFLPMKFAKSSPKLQIITYPCIVRCLLVEMPVEDSNVKHGSFVFHKSFNRMLSGMGVEES